MNNLFEEKIKGFCCNLEIRVSGGIPVVVKAEFKKNADEWKISNLNIMGVE